MGMGQCDARVERRRHLYPPYHHVSIQEDDDRDIENGSSRCTLSRDRPNLPARVSVSSVPAMVMLSISLFPPASRPADVEIFFKYGFPNLLVVIQAYVGARVIRN